MVALARRLQIFEERNIWAGHEDEGLSESKL